MDVFEIITGFKPKHTEYMSKGYKCEIIYRYGLDIFVEERRSHNDWFVCIDKRLSDVALVPENKQFEAVNLSMVYYAYLPVKPKKAFLEQAQELY